MKFGFKMFLVAFLIMIIVFGSGGFFLVNSYFSDNLESKINSERENNLFMASSLVALVKNGESFGYNANMLHFSVERYISQMEGKKGDTQVRIGMRSQTQNYPDKTISRLPDIGEFIYVIYTEDKKHYIRTLSCFELMEREYYIDTVTDISQIYTDRDNYCRLYQVVLSGVAVLFSGVLWIFSYLLTRPLSKLTKIAGDISAGDYSKRANVSQREAGSLEVWELSRSFDTMTESLEEHMDMLREEASRRDDFVANFTHELKTPLTSIIGYSDMLRSYDLPESQRNDCAECIYKEGRRLETLSQSLLSLMVYKNKEPQFEKESVAKIFEESKASLKFLLETYSVELAVTFEDTDVLCEEVMIKTLIYNLVDNSAKASEKGGKIELSGKISEDKYLITVKDFGRGIPEEELKKIKEPFYMVDKSRERKKGGAGLGLALCDELAKLHFGELRVKSKVGEGTEVSFTLPIYKEVNNDEKG